MERERKPSAIFINKTLLGLFKLKLFKENTSDENNSYSLGGPHGVIRPSCSHHAIALSATLRRGGKSGEAKSENGGECAPIIEGI